MASDDTFRTLDAVAARLPFALMDMDAAGGVFVRWRRTGAEADHRTVDIWTYCFVRRYYLVKFIQTGDYNTSHLEDVLEKAYGKIREKRTQIRDPSRYAHWVHVVCRNTYRNHLRSRSRRQEVAFDDFMEHNLSVEEPAPTSYDAGAVRECALRAIEHLPRYVREVAIRRLIRDESYEDISNALDRPLPTVRTYMHKAVRQLRDDPSLQVYLEELLDD